MAISALSQDTPSYIKPRHIAIVLDGNRRFAKKLMIQPWKGHEYGAEKTEKLIDWCIEQGFEELTLYAFSLQNFNRPKEEFDFLMKLFQEEFTKFRDDPRIQEYDIKVNFLGRYKLFPPKVWMSMDKLMQKTHNNKGFILNFAMAYGGREELTDALKILAHKISTGELKPENINEDTIGSSLYINSDPDIIIRTGGEKRTSNFLPWQSIYSEWFFIDMPWPEFEKQDLLKVLEEYNHRIRRFGR